MPVKTYLGKRFFRSFVAKGIFCSMVMLLVVCVISSAQAGIPAGGNVYIYNVGVGSFSVVWQVDVPSTDCTVKVYSDNGTTLIKTVTNTGLSELAKARGLMQVDITALPLDPAKYYIQTSSTEIDSGITDDWPAAGSLKTVTTEKFFNTLAPLNGLLDIILYDSNGINPNNHTENMQTDGVVMIVEAGGNYPISSTGSGFPQNQFEGLYYSVTADFSQLRSGVGIGEQPNYYDWVNTQHIDHTITIMCFGGLVPGVGIGTRTKTTTYPKEMIGSEFGCLSDYNIYDLDSCLPLEGTSIANKLILYTNRSPVITLDPPGGNYFVNRGAQTSLQVCAYDPDKDTITDIYLLDANKPSGMSIQYPYLGDANCANITWTPSTGGFYKNISVAGTDGISSPVIATFKYTVQNGPPLTPVVSIEPSAPYTNDEIICRVDPNSIIDPDNDTISIDYIWYETNNPTNVYQELNVVFNDQDPTTYTSTLDPSKTEKGRKYYCKVKAHDKDGNSPEVETSQVTVLNSLPSAPTSATITPGNADSPKTTQALTCTIVPGPSDPDDDTVTHKFEWSGSGGKTYASTGYIGGTTHVLPASQTTKGDTWTCAVTAYDGTQESASSKVSDSVTIVNSPPKTPNGAAITPASPNTTQGLTCTVTPATSPIDDDPGDVAGIKYEYTWSCANCGNKPAVTNGPKTGPTDTLGAGNTAKGESWSCAVKAVDGSNAYSSSVTASAVTIQNSPPSGLAAQVTPAPDAYVDTTLTCNITVPSDPDGDTIEYKYEWKEQGSGKVVTHDFSTSHPDNLASNNTLRGETWYCKVTARDTSSAQIDANSNTVYIKNRPPTIATNPAQAKQTWQEGNQYTIQVIGGDPDGDGLVYGVDPNYTDPDDAEVAGWIEFDPNNGTLTATPTAGSSSANMGYGNGVYKFNFTVKDIMKPQEDAALSVTAKKLVEVQVQFPAMIVENFEYPETKSTLIANGWYWVQGTGQMLLKTEDVNDPNTNHYLQTKLSTTPSNNSQLGYMVTKLQIPEGIFTYPELRFDIKDKNKYYFDAYVRAFKGTSEKNYFLRYVPEDPPNTYTVSGTYITCKIGSEFYDPNGRQIKSVARNMDQDLFDATQYHFKYLKGILVRGDIEYLDNIAVALGDLGDTQAPNEVMNLTASVDDQKVYLGWTLDPNQADDIAGYKIYIKANTPPEKDTTLLLATVSPNTSSYTVTKTPDNVNLVNGTTYHFLVTAFDNSRLMNESAGKRKSATPTQDTTPPLAPENLDGISTNRIITLTWNNPPNQASDTFQYEVYYDDCTQNCLIKSLKPASPTNPDESFSVSIAYDKDGNRLELGEYKFIVKARDNAAAGPNYSDPVPISVNVTTPPSTLIDNFEYQAGQTLMHNGWYRLLGSGAFSLKSEGGNHYLKMVANYTGTSAINYMVTKWLTDPENYNNPELRLLVRSPGYFRIDVYLRGSDGKNYWICYKGNPATTTDSGPVAEKAGWYVYTLGWAGNAVGTPLPWGDIERNLDSDLANAKPGVQFEHVLGFIVRGTLDIDDMELFKTTGDVVNLTARPGDLSVLLSWSVEDPNVIDDTIIYVDGDSLDPDTENPVGIPGTNDYQYNVTGLTNNRSTPYEFKVALLKGTKESRGVTVSATPRDFAVVDTFDDIGAWTPDIGGVSPTKVYSSEVQSYVMHFNPNHVRPERYTVTKELSSISSVTNIALRIKSEIDTNFIIWVEITDDTGLPFWIGFVPGGSANTYVWHGWLAYYYLGSGYTDGKWHYIDKNLENILDGMLGVGLGSIDSVSVGGKIRVDDLAIY